MIRNIYMKHSCGHIELYRVLSYPSELPEDFHAEQEADAKQRRLEVCTACAEKLERMGTGKDPIPKNKRPYPTE